MSGPRATKWPKLNCQLKIVNYFTHVCDTSFVGIRDPQSVDLNSYPRISNPYCRDIQIRRCNWPQGPRATKWPKVNQLLKRKPYGIMQSFFLGISKYIIYLVEIILDYFAVVPSVCKYWGPCVKWARGGCLCLSHKWKGVWGWVYESVWTHGWKGLGDGCV